LVISTFKGGIGMKKLAKTLLGVALLSGVVLANPVTPVTKHETTAQERFEHVKARILHMIDKRIGFLQKHKACVEKAQNWKELRACRPHRKMWYKHMKKAEKK
jgi:hypothetical protein